jgi:hypothetical protein
LLLLLSRQWLLPAAPKPVENPGQWQRQAPAGRLYLATELALTGPVALSAGPGDRTSVVPDTAYGGINLRISQLRHRTKQSKNAYNSSAMSGTKKTTLNEFSGASWNEFVQKTKGTYSAKKTASGRSHWEILQGDDPREEGRKTVTTVVEAQIQRTLLINDARVPMTDQAGSPVMDAVENKTDTQEDLAIFQARCNEWDEVMSQVWCDLLQCCVGEPAMLPKSVADKQASKRFSSAGA